MQRGAAPNKVTDWCCCRRIRNQSARCKKQAAHNILTVSRPAARRSLHVGSSEGAEQIVFSPCLAERTPVRGLLFDFPYVLEFFLLSRAFCEEEKPAAFDERLKTKACLRTANNKPHQMIPVRSLRSSSAV